MSEKIYIVERPIHGRQLFAVEAKSAKEARLKVNAINLDCIIDGVEAFEVLIDKYSKATLAIRDDKEPTK